MGTMEDLSKLEAVFRRIAREEIARAVGAAGAVADGAMEATGGAADVARGVVANVMERVARDVLADKHPALDTEHAPDDACTCGHDFYRHRAGACFACQCPGFTEHTASTPAVHTITAVPERARLVCTCSGHVHVMGHDDRCGAPFCYCITPVRARTEHTPGTDDPDYNRPCSACGHGEHDQGKCAMHVYRRGEAVPCPCLASRTVRSTPSTGARVACSSCEHAPHGAGSCGTTYAVQGIEFRCACGGRV